MLVAWAIPDVPRKLSDKIKREDYVTREVIIDQEKRRARTSVPNTPTPIHDRMFDSNSEEINGHMDYHKENGSGA